MTIPLRQSTASQEIPLGHFLDSIDGNTEETALTIANTDIKLWKHGATTLANKNAGSAAHIGNGVYYCVLDATDTNTLGGLVIFVHVSGALAVRVECEVLPANTFDSFILGTDALHADLLQMGGVTQSATDLKDFADAGYDPATNKVQGVVLTDTCTTNTDMVGTPPTVGEIRTEMEGAGTKLLAIEGDTNELQTDWVNGGRLDNLLDACNTVTPDAAGVAPTAAEIKTEVEQAGSSLAQILTDTGTTLDGKLNTIDGNVDSILTDTGTTLETHLTDMKGATFAGATDSLEAIRDRGDAAWTTGAGGSDRLLMVDTTIATLASQTSFTLTAGSADNDAYNNCTIVIEDAATATQKAVGIVSAYTGATKTVTLKYDPAVFTIATTDKVYILAENALKATLANRQLNVAADGDVAGNVDGSVASVVGHTAQTGDSYAIVNNGTHGNAAIETLVDDIESRLTAARAGYLDNLSAGAVALAATALTDVTWTDAKAGHLDAPISTVDTVVDGIQTDLSNATDGLGALKALIDTIDGIVDTILVDTNELQTDWVNGGRLDLILDIIAADTTTDIPAKLLKYVQLLSRSDAAIATDNSTELTAINADGGSGAGDFSNQTDAPEAIRNRGDAEWITATGFNTVVPDAAGVAPTAAEIRQEMDANSTKMAPSQVLADYKATGFNTVVPDAAGVAPTAAEIKTEIEQAGSILAQILADTGTDGVLLAATATSAQLVDDIWDEIITGAFHNIVNSAARRLRAIGAYAIHDGTAQAGTTSTITLAATADGTDGIFNRNLIVLTDNTGKGQTRTIVDYNSTTKVVVVDRDWRVSPDATTTYQIVPDDTPLTVDHGIAQGGTATTITIRDYASSINDAYLCNIVTILAGTGRGQARLVGAYNGTTNVVTICGDDWGTIPDTTSVYAMMPYGVACAACVGDEARNTIADGVLDELTADHTIAGSLSKAVADTLEDTDNLQTNQGAWATATSVTVSDKTGFSLSAAGIAAIWDEVVEGAHTARQYLRTFAAVLLGKVTGGSTPTIVFRDVGDTKDRVTATVTEDGNRTNVVLDES